MVLGPTFPALWQLDGSIWTGTTVFETSRVIYVYHMELLQSAFSATYCKSLDQMSHRFCGLSDSISVKRMMTASHIGEKHSVQSPIIRCLCTQLRKLIIVELYHLNFYVSNTKLWSAYVKSLFTVISDCQLRNIWGLDITDETLQFCYFGLWRT